MNTPNSLHSQLSIYQASFLAKAPAEKIKAYEEGIDAVLQSGILDQALATGDEAPDFQLSNATGQAISLAGSLSKGPVILTWYRGGWCPYCNMSLRALQEYLPAFQEKGANLLSLTQEMPDHSINTQQKHALQFEVLTDQNNEVARKYGIVFSLTPEVAAYYKAAFDLEAYNGNTSNELPLAASYVIQPNGRISWAFLDVDYRNRAEPEAILAALG
ncbi:MAG: peroxiredoxin-like family protein [Bacteroidota bacterium]